MVSEAVHSARAVEASSGALAEWIVARQYERRPELEVRYGPVGRGMWRTDVQSRLHQLAHALSVGRPEFFRDSAAWSKVAFASREVAVDDLRLSLECTIEVIREQLPPSVADCAARIVEGVIDELDAMPESVGSALEGGEPLDDLAREYLVALIEGKREDAIALLERAFEEGASYETICLRVVRPAMVEVGRMWHLNEIGVADEHACTATSGAALARLFGPALRRRRPAPRGRTAIVGSAGGDMHELGARMVSDFLELDGWTSVYLGANTPAIDFVAAAASRRADLVAISASTSLAVRGVQEVVAGMRGASGCERTRILVGGAPFGRAPGLWQQLGADGVAGDAAEAVEVARRLVGE